MNTLQTEPTRRILTIGECMVELAPSDAPGDFRLGFAGDTFNTAWYIARLKKNVAVSFCTSIGTDAISEQMRAAMTMAGIDDSHVRSMADRTVGLYLITLDKGERSFSYWRGQSAARHLADDIGALTRAIEAADLVFFSGITLAILAPSARTSLLDALSAARAQGKIIAFDPNLRPRLWADPAEMTQAIMHGAAVSDIALPSFEDEASWFHDANPEATADRYAAAGATTVIVKNGSLPVHYLHHDLRGNVEVPAVPSIIDTTAAGDSFNAAILVDIQSATPLPDVILRACKLAGQVVQGKGALVPITVSP